jgi:hypothetical protein
VVELQDNRIGFATVDALMGEEVVPDIFAGGFSTVYLVVPDIGDVCFSFALVPGLALPGLTRLTGSPPLSPLLVTKTEV